MKKTVIFSLIVLLNLSFFPVGTINIVSAEDNLDSARELQRRAVFNNNLSKPKESLSSKNLEVKKKSEKLPYVPGEVLVKFKKQRINLEQSSGQIKIRTFAEIKNLEKKDEIKKSNIAVLKIKGEETVEEMINKLKSDPNVEYVQPNFLYYPLTIDTNDTYRDKLWGLDNYGQEVGGVSGTPNADINILDAWAISEGDEDDIIVAVIDSGVAYNHPDIASNMWDGSNCLDDEGNYLGGCNHGYDYEDNDKTPLATISSHGTHITGTIGAIKNNSKGIIGVAPNVKIMALKGLQILPTNHIVKSMNFAKHNGAKVINASWGGSFEDTALYNAINSFPGLFIAAAGNGEEFGDPNIGDNHDESGISLYPCDYDLDNIICVAATDQDDSLVEWSDYGSTSVDVGAPGVNIYSTVAGTDVFSEDFESVTVGYNTGQFTPGGITTNWWGVGNDGSSKVIYSDYFTKKFAPSYPYGSNASTWIMSNSLDLSGSNIEGATLSFMIWCDTPIGPNFPDISNPNDYVQTSFYANGIWNNSIKYDEDKIWLEGGDNWIDEGYSGYYKTYTEDISDYLSNNFIFSFDWHTDSSVDYNLGCTIDNIKITKYTDGSDEQYAYGYMQGTSMAAPHVAGLAGLIWGYKPELSYSEVKDVILTTGDSLDSLDGKTVTGKRINAFNALDSLVATSTEVSGDITGNTTWTLENSPYIITDSIQVLEGVTLTIDPGVIVKFNQRKPLYALDLSIYGSLKAMGTENNMITFTSNQENPQRGSAWGRIEFLDGSIGTQFNDNNEYLGGSIIKYSKIEYAHSAIESTYTPLYIDNNIITNNHNGVSLYGVSDLGSVISNNIIINSIGYNVYLMSSNNVISSNVIENAETTHSIYIHSFNNEIKNNIIRDNERGGIYIMSGTQVNDDKLGLVVMSANNNVIINNIISDNNYGISYFDHNRGDTIGNVIRNNTITNNNIGINFEQYNDKNIFEITYNNIFGNTNYNFKFNNSSAEINMPHNYWGTRDTSVIDETIFDYHDDNSLGEAIYPPYAMNELDFDDVTAPTLIEVTSVSSPTNNTTPDYIFNSDEAGTISYAGGCTSDTIDAIEGDNTLTFNELADGIYSNCTIVVTDAVGNQGELLNITEFIIDSIPPTLTEVTPIPALTNDNTPDYTFNTDETGTISYSGGCTSTTTDAVAGDNIIIFDELADGVYDSCTLTVTDASDNISDPLAISAFTIDTEPPIITLIGSSTIELFVGDPYEDDGATALDNIDGDITGSIIKGGDEVDTSTPGTYIITYNVSDSVGSPAIEVTRTVNVVDTTAPVITLLGDNPVTIEVGSEYIDDGATALDNVDGDITDNIIVNNPVATSTVGIYIITYNVTDSSDNPAEEVIRIVNVTPDVTPPVITLNGGNMNIYQGTEYNEPGATATDNIDGDISPVNIGGDTVDTTATGTYMITYNVFDVAGNPAIEVSRTVTVLPIEEDQVVLEENMDLATTTSEVLIGDNSPSSAIINIPSTVTNAQLNVSAIMDGTNATIPGSLNIDSDTSIGGVNVQISSGTQVSGEAGWTGVIHLPQVQENSSVSATPDSGYTSEVTSVIEIGFDDTALNFDQAVRIQLNGQAGRYIGYSRGGVFTPITDTCSADTQEAGNALAEGAECKINVGDDLVIWTKHFTKFVSYNQTAIPTPTPPPSGGSADTTPPAQPTNFIAAREEGTISLSWTNPTGYDFYKVILVKNLEEIGDTVAGKDLDDHGDIVYEGNKEEYKDVDIDMNNIYYYALSSYDRRKNYSKPIIIKLTPEDKEVSSTQAPEEVLLEEEEVEVLGIETDYRTIQLNKILDEAAIVYTGNANLIMNNAGKTRDINAEIEGNNKYTSSLIKGFDLPSDSIYAITNFIVYGTETTLMLGAGERAGVINSYKSAFNKLPITQSEWEDVIKIANGRWPSERSEQAEERAKVEFKKVYLRDPDMNNPNDNAAVTVIAYGLRPDDRNLESEKSAIKIFKAIYGYNPSSAVDWDIVRAIAYSGATR